MEARLRSGPYLLPREIVALARHLRNGRDEKVVGAIFPPGSPRPRGLPSPPVVNSSLDAILGFLIWCVENGRRDEVSPVIRDRAAEKLKRLFSRVKLNNASSKPRYALTEANLDIVLRRILPEAKDNPFNRPVRLRNYCLICTFLETGIRRAELCVV